MSDRDSLGSIMVADNSPFAINDAFRQLADRIDEIKGLRGRSLIFDRTKVSDPTELTDAVNLGSTAGVIVTLTTDQTISGAKTFTGATVMVVPIRIVDASGFLIHAFGTKT
jgi:hypothetical protein